MGLFCLFIFCVCTCIGLYLYVFYSKESQLTQKLVEISAVYLKGQLQGLYLALFSFILLVNMHFMTLALYFWGMNYFVFLQICSFLNKFCRNFILWPKSKSWEVDLHHRYEFTLQGKMRPGTWEIFLQVIKGWKFGDISGFWSDVFIFQKIRVRTQDPFSSIFKEQGIFSLHFGVNRKTAVSFSLYI